MINVTNRADVHMRLITLKLFLCHDGLLGWSGWVQSPILSCRLGEFRLNFFTDVLWYWVVMVELHRELRAAR